MLSRWSLLPLGLLVVAGAAAACEGLSPGDQLLNDQQSVSCTLAFLVANRDGLYFATAGHCGQVNDTVRNPPAIDHDGVGAFGTFVFHHLDPEDGGVSGQQAGSPGDDFGLIAIDPSLWTEVNPKVCEIDGPTGIYDLAPGSGGVRHFGYGTIVGELPQTRPREGVGLTNDNVAFHWVGAGVPGDSGSAVVHEDGRALGVLTHLTPGAVPQTNGGTHLLRGFALAEAKGFAPLRLVLAGEDPLLVLAKLRDPAATAPAQPPTATPPVQATPTTGNSTSPKPSTPSNSTAPEASAAGSANASADADATTEAVVPAATDGTGKKRTPAPGLALVAIALLVALARRR